MPPKAPQKFKDAKQPRNFVDNMATAIYRSVESISNSVLTIKDKKQNRVLPWSKIRKYHHH